MIPLNRKITTLLAGVLATCFPAVGFIYALQAHNITYIVIYTTLMGLVFLFVPPLIWNVNLKDMEKSEKEAEEEKQWFVSNENKAIDEYSDNVIFYVNDLLHDKPWFSKSMKSKLVKAIISKLGSV
jgi:hypothetical protein